MGLLSPIKTKSHGTSTERGCIVQCVWQPLDQLNSTWIKVSRFFISSCFIFRDAIAGPLCCAFCFCFASHLLAMAGKSALSRAQE